MATIFKNKSGNWEVQIRRRGYPAQTATFDTKPQARKWADAVEGDMARSRFVPADEADRTSFREVIERYETEILPGLRGKVQDASRLRALKKLALSGRAIGLIRSADIAAYLKEMESKGYSADTIRLHLGIISRLFAAARRRWGMESISNPIQFVQKPKTVPGRERRVTIEEEKQLLAAAHRELRDAMVLAIETAMRRGELLKLRWEHIDLRAATARIIETKTDVSRTIPLTPRALETLKSMPRRIDGQLFSWHDAHSVTRGFERLCHKLKIENLRWHDLRHEATSRLFERGLALQEVAAVTGHKTWVMLKRYTHPRPEDIARKLATFTARVEHSKLN